MNKNFNDWHRYDDIINLPWHRSKNHKPMPLTDRAAQFAPFSALTGHDAAIKETARLTIAKPILDENQKTILNAQLNYILQHLTSQPEIKVTYFKKDNTKEGGSFEINHGKVNKIDLFANIIIMADKTKIAVNDIVMIESDIFTSLEL